MAEEKSSVSSVIPNVPAQNVPVLVAGVAVDSKKCGSSFSRLTLEDYGFSKRPSKSKKKHKLPKRSSSSQ